MLPEIARRHEELLAQRRSEPKDTDDIDYDVTVVEFAAAEAARASLERLVSRLNGWVGSRPIKLIIYFDEAHPLTKVTPKDDDEKTLYDFLCSCLNQFLAIPMFCIFLSTNSSLAQFAPPRAFARSARIRGGKAAIHAPITETPFDCSGVMIKPGEWNIEKISTVPFMAQFGSHC